MRSYRQFCAVAKALDVVGDRWTLLMVRELLIRGPCRYTDLQEGLPGIATNLLADRLRKLESAGLVRREPASPPRSTPVFRLTARGEQLEPALHQLGRWGAALLATPGKRDRFRSHWLALPARLHLRDRQPRSPAVTLEVRAGGRPLVIEAAAGKVGTRVGAAEAPDARLAGPAELVVALIVGRLGLSAARAAGVSYEGDPMVLGRMQPDALRDPEKVRSRRRGRRAGRGSAARG
jgi:DNA-binding HxlR family transcriptional regulator